MIKRIYNVNNIPSSKEEVFDSYLEVFTDIGKFPGVYSIKLPSDAVPVIQHQRKIPFSLHDKLKEILLSLESKIIISKVDYPTQWVNSLMLVEKPDKSLRLCIDPKPLNKYILREHFQIPTNNDIVSKLTGLCLFSVVDMKDGFWQVALDGNSADLCTINTPFERNRFNCLPFGIASAPEIFQRKCLVSFW